jgi:hypothetical protein
MWNGVSHAAPRHHLLLGAEGEAYSFLGGRPSLIAASTSARSSASCALRSAFILQQRAPAC